MPGIEDFGSLARSDRVGGSAPRLRLPPGYFWPEKDPGTFFISLAILPPEASRRAVGATQTEGVPRSGAFW